MRVLNLTDDISDSVEYDREIAQNSYQNNIVYRQIYS